ncbi:efflux RND transporter periplasmic adaptor subunit [Shewanella sp. YLB-07]|uniref:efflux RND transporter periplasmic adaptor subunit n=1 Tax=Shewanella sp. YLB-07 TaxID=2601268 RepID=UPI00128E7E6D|nr:efflux RND transporter periplasmic adaptor subunit [Shewanella sp. YLB-07]MPY23938.1 efflux RND transporter periplasmic adaptor subunit [Shewanella sp. YLB-07]
MKNTSLLLVLLIFLFGCDSNQTNKAKEKEIYITSALVESQTILDSVKLVGTLVAKKSVVITSEVDGRVEMIRIADSEYVEKGDILLTLNNDLVKAELAEAQAYLKDETRKLDEYIQLGLKGGVSQTIKESQQNSVDIAQAKLDAARVNFNDHQLVAPFSGVLGLGNITVGQRLIKDESLMTLDDLSLMQVDLNIPEKYISKLTKGLIITTKFSAWRNETFIGVVEAIDSRVQPQSLDIKIRVSIPNLQQKLKPGMLAHAKLQFPSYDYTVLPLQAIEYAADQTYVYIIDDKQIANRIEVELGDQFGELMTVISGLSPGQRIVTEGLVNIQDQDMVKESTIPASEATK